MKSENYLEECRAALTAKQAQSLATTTNWAHVDKQKVHANWDALYRKISPLIDSLHTSAEPVQELIAEHYKIVYRFYESSKEVCIGMSLLYGEDQSMITFHNAYHQNMVPFMKKLLGSYSVKRCSATPCKRVLPATFTPLALPLPFPTPKWL